MSFALSPKHIKKLPIGNLTTNEFLIISIESAKKLGWDISIISENSFIAFTKFSISSWSEEIKVKIENDIATLKSECTGSQLLDFGKNKKNIDQLVSTINEIKTTITQEELIRKINDIQPQLISNEQASLSKANTKENLTSFMSLFKPTEDYFITPILININVIIFILMVISGVNFMMPNNESLILWGANYKPVTLDGGWWRIITSCFIHIGVFHLLLNMYALVYIGLLLEPYLGKVRFITAYLLTGITASMASLWWHDLTISAGASGAIFGMYGVFLAMLTSNLIEKSTRKALLTSIAVFVCYNLVNGLRGGIDNAAHIGGLIGGLLIGYSFLPSLKKTNDTNLKYLTVGTLSIFIISISILVFIKIPNDIKKYDQKLEEFVTSEELALSIYNLPENTPKDKLLQEIKEKGIYNWNKNLKLIKELEKLELPEMFRLRNAKLIEYCEVRIKNYNLLYKAINENTSIYKDSIEKNDKTIEAIIKSLEEI